MHAADKKIENKYVPSGDDIDMPSQFEAAGDNGTSVKYDEHIEIKMPYSPDKQGTYMGWHEFKVGGKKVRINAYWDTDDPEATKRSVSEQVRNNLRTSLDSELSPEELRGHGVEFKNNKLYVDGKSYSIEGD